METGHGIGFDPSIGVDLTIRHGSSDTVLDMGAGHLHGTSLPVGGPSTHTALTGHRGLADKMMFTRLDELHKGSVFYIHTLGRTLAYKVTDIRVVDPGQVDSLRIVKGQDLATLVTCTPYGSTRNACWSPASVPACRRPPPTSGTRRRTRAPQH